MAVSTTKENIFTKFGAFISRIWHSISNFFKPDNIEEVPVSSLSTYLRTHLKFIENIHDANDEKYLKKIFLSGIETTLKATNDKELENRIKNFSNFYQNIFLRCKNCKI